MCHIVFFFLKIVINCQISTIQSQLLKSAAACFYSYKIKAQEVTELLEMQRHLATNSNSNRVGIRFYNKIQCCGKASILFVPDHQTHLCFFFQGWTCWCVSDCYPAGNPGVYIANYTFFVKRSFRSSDSP